VHEQRNAHELRIARFLIPKSLGRNRVILVVRPNTLHDNTQHDRPSAIAWGCLITYRSVRVLSFRKRRSDHDTQNATSGFYLVKIQLLDPRDFNGNIYGDLGVGRTSHLFKCEASVMDEYHFHDGAQIVRTISDEMLRLCPDVNIGQSISAATAEEEKVKWKKSIAQLQKTLSPKKTDCNICKHKLR